jgi:hypothetical protein
MQFEGRYSVRELRHIMLKQGYVLMGLMSGNEYSYFDRALDDIINLNKDDCLIVIGEK